MTDKQLHAIQQMFGFVILAIALTVPDGWRAYFTATIAAYYIFVAPRLRSSKELIA